MKTTYKTYSSTYVNMIKALHKLDLVLTLNIKERWHSLGHYHEEVEYELVFE
jgi:hypothetical protein